MQHNHNLITKYLGIIQEQENMINELSKSNVQLVKRNNELNQHKKMYKENTLYWKAEHDKLQQCLIDIKVKCVSVYEANAISIYKQNQNQDEDNNGYEILIKISEYMHDNMEHSEKDFKAIERIRRNKKDESFVNVEVGAIKRVINDYEKERSKILEIALGKKVDKNV